MDLPPAAHTTTMQLRSLLDLNACLRPASANDSPAQASTSHGDYDDVLMAHAPEEDVDSGEEGLDGDDEDNGDDQGSDESTADDAHHLYHHPQIYHQPHHIVPHHVPIFYPSNMYSSDPTAMSDMDVSEDECTSSLYTNAVGLLSSDMDDSLDTLDTPAEYHFGSLSFVGGNSPGPPHAPLLQQASLAPLAVDFTNMLASLPDSVQPPPSTVSLEAPAAEMPPPADWLEPAHPIASSNPNPHTLGGANLGLADFLHHWARQTRSTSILTRERAHYPWPTKIHDMVSKSAKKVQFADLEGDLCDIQGINWEDLGVARKEARERRLLTYNNYVSTKNSDRWMPNLPDVALPRTESFFRFRRMDIRNNVALSHFQLRNILAAASRTRTFYPGVDSVYQFNPVSGESRAVMKLSHTPGSPAPQVSTIAADHGVLIAGLFNGEYLLRRLDADEPEPPHHGVITTNPSGITNHVQIHKSRTSSSPLAAFSSNDMVFRVLDLATDTVVATHEYPFPLNCSALSPDGRLRVMVGDDKKVLISTADSSTTSRRPDILQALGGHRDYGFACDWADDGWTVATGFQDKSVKIWDARRWTDAAGNASPVCTLRAEMAGVRGLRFSPVGSGRRVLVAAEEADYVSIIDAQTFRAKQTVDLFGEIGGVAFSNGGQELSVLCCDQARGGLLQLERCGTGEEAVWWEEEEGQQPQVFGKTRLSRGTTYDWSRMPMTEERRVKDSKTRRRRRGADGEIDPF